jgi:signal transduction histidine kinase
MEAERFAALGKIADRIAHEIRNPVTVIGGFARRMDEKTSEDDPYKKYVRIILHEVSVLEQRVSDLIKMRP